MQGRVKAVRCLIDAGADPLVKDEFGHFSLHALDAPVK